MMFVVSGVHTNLLPLYAASVMYFFKTSKDFLGSQPVFNWINENFVNFLTF
jgi:hypothetical protein